MWFALTLELRAQTAPRTTLDMTLERGFYGWKLVFILWLVDFLNMGFPLYGGAVINTYPCPDLSRGHVHTYSAGEEEEEKGELKGGKG